MSLQEKLEKARQNLDLSIESQEEIAQEELSDNLDDVENSYIFDVVTNSKETLLSSLDEPEGQADVIQLYQLVQDFEYIRETLRENQQNGRRVLRSVQDEIMDSEEAQKASLILSFQELNKAIQENIKLYISTYKSITETLKNIQTIQKTQNLNKPKDVKALESNSENITTADIIARLRDS